jgi:predicted nucleotidyltransferase
LLSGHAVVWPAPGLTELVRVEVPQAGDGEVTELSVGVEAELRAQLSEFPGVDVALIHGSWVESRVTPTSDVDVLVLGNVDNPELRARVRKVERRVGRQIDLIAYRPDEFRELASDNGFARAILAGPTKPLVGSLESVIGK